MKPFIALGIIVILLAVGYLLLSGHETDPTDITEETATTTPNEASMEDPVSVRAISHASMALDWNDLTIVIDPVGEMQQYQGIDPDIILITDIHGDHLSTSTLEQLMSDAVIIVPQAVEDLLSEEIKARTEVLNNNDRQTVRGLSIMAVPMYNIPETDDSRHVKGRGNGYLLEQDGYRVYIAGDTGATPEMRALTDIDLAFVPMNLPFTMSVEEAAEAVKDFKPAKVYPYHYRGQNGFSDISEFKRLVDEGNVGTEVVLLNWYPQP